MLAKVHADGCPAVDPSWLDTRRRHLALATEADGLDQSTVAIPWYVSFGHAHRVDAVEVGRRATDPSEHVSSHRTIDNWS